MRDAATFCVVDLKKIRYSFTDSWWCACKHSCVFWAEKGHSTEG